MKDTCKEAILGEDNREPRRVEDPLRAGDLEESRTGIFNIDICDLGNQPIRNFGYVVCTVHVTIQIKP